MVMSSCSMMLEPFQLYNKSLAFETGNASWWFVFLGGIVVLECLKWCGHCLAACGILEKRCCRMQVYRNNDDMDDNSMISTWSRPRNWFSFNCVWIYLFWKALVTFLASSRRKPRNELIYMRCDGQRREGTNSFLMWMSYDFCYASSIYFLSILLWNLRKGQVEKTKRCKLKFCWKKFWGI